MMSAWMLDKGVDSLCCFAGRTRRAQHKVAAHLAYSLHDLTEAGFATQVRLQCNCSHERPNKACAQSHAFQGIELRI